MGWREHNPFDACWLETGAADVRGSERWDGGMGRGGSGFGEAGVGGPVGGLVRAVPEGRSSGG